MTTCSFVVDTTLSATTPSGAKTFDLASNKYHVLLAKGSISGQSLTYHDFKTPSNDPISFSAASLASGSGSDGWLIQVSGSSCQSYLYLSYGIMGLVNAIGPKVRSYKCLSKPGNKVWVVPNFDFCLVLVFFNLQYFVLFSELKTGVDISSLLGYN